MRDPGIIYGYPPCCVNWFDSMTRGTGIPNDWPSLEGPLRTEAEQEKVRREVREWTVERLTARGVLTEAEAAEALAAYDEEHWWDQDERPHWRPCPYHRANPPPGCTLVSNRLPPDGWEGC